MTTTRTPFFGTMRDLLIAFGIGIRNKLSKPYTHWPKQRHGVSAKGPWGRHRGSEFRGYRRAAARGPGTYSEHDLLVRNFGRKATDLHLTGRGSGTWPKEAMDVFLQTFRETGDADKARAAVGTLS